MGNKTSIISTLTSHYGDEALTQIIIAAQKMPRTQTLATELQTRQLKYWMADKKASADLYKLLMLDNAGDKLLESPQLVTWVSYVDDFNRRNPRNSKSSISILTKYYGDDALSKMLLQAEIQTSKSANIATKLQVQQIQHWLATLNSPADVFKYLMLNKAADKLFDNPQFSTWIKYVDDFNKQNPDNRTPLVSVLAKHYNNEELTKMVEAAKKIPGLEKIVKRLGTG